MLNLQDIDVNFLKFAPPRWFAAPPCRRSRPAAFAAVRECRGVVHLRQPPRRSEPRSLRPPVRRAGRSDPRNFPRPAAAGRTGGAGTTLANGVGSRSLKVDSAMSWWTSRSLGGLHNGWNIDPDGVHQAPAGSTLGGAGQQPRPGRSAASAFHAEPTERGQPSSSRGPTASVPSLSCSFGLGATTVTSLLRAAAASRSS